MATRGALHNVGPDPPGLRFGRGECLMMKKRIDTVQKFLLLGILCFSLPFGLYCDNSEFNCVFVCANPHNDGWSGLGLVCVPNSCGLLRCKLRAGR